MTRFVRMLGPLVLAATLFAIPSAATAETLLSEYTFDSTADNAISGATSGTVSDAGDHYTANAAVGSAAMNFDNTYRFDTGAAGYPNSTAGLATGSFSYWFSSTNTTVNSHVFHAYSSGKTGIAIAANTSSSGASSAGNVRFYLRDSSNHAISAGLNSAMAGLVDGNWHLLTITWDTAISGGSNVVQYYVDGQAQTTKVSTSEILAGESFSEWTNTTIGCQANTSAGYYTGLLDDVSAWSGRLSAAQAAAIYNLGADSLDYGVKDAQVLFDVFAAGEGGTAKATSDGKLWAYTTGLTGTAGQVLNHNSVVFDAAAGVGVTCVPEPASFVMVVIGLVGLATYAWRKRK